MTSLRILRSRFSSGDDCLGAKQVNMAKNEGALIFFDEAQRRELLKERIHSGHLTFSDALSLPDWKVRTLQVVLLAFSESTIDYIALLRRGRKVATAKVRVDFSDLVPLFPISISELESRLKENVRRYFIRTSRGTGGVIPEKTWTEIIAIVKELHPDSAKEVDRLLALRTYSGYRFTGQISDVLLQEREALGSALDIFTGSNQLRERMLGGWAPPPEAVEEENEERMEAKLVAQDQGSLSFLSRIPNRYLQEESALQHDLFNWPRMTPTIELQLSFSRG